MMGDGPTPHPQPGFVTARVSRLLKKHPKPHHQEQNASRTINFRHNLKKAIKIVQTPPQNGKQSLTKENLPVDTARQEEKRKAATIMEEPSGGLHEKEKHGRRYGRSQTFLAFISGQAALSCIDPNNNNNNNNKFNKWRPIWLVQYSTSCLHNPQIVN